MSLDTLIPDLYAFIVRLGNDQLFLYNFIKTWGWLVLFFPITWMAHLTFVYSRIAKNRAKWKWILLAIDVPKDNEQGPRAVENIFAQLAGAHGSQDIEEIHFEGETQKWFSFEIVSIEGYVQFLIYTEKGYRNLLEAAIYAQYPDAEITEVEDYTKVVPSAFPDEEWDVWGADFKLVKQQHYPIKVHTEYEDSMFKTFHDPMTALIETMSRMGPGEQLWLQILIKPIGITWKEEGYKLVNELAGKPVKSKANMLGTVGQVPGKIWDEVITHGFGGAPMEGVGEEKREMPSNLLHLTPGEKSGIEAVERKLSKIGFSCKIRILYVGRKGYFKKSNAVQAIVGSIKQFNTEDLNAIIPDMSKTAVTAHYMFKAMRKNWRKNRIMGWYKSRSHWAGTKEFVLNTEELATIWHFPVTKEGQAGAPMLSQTKAKKAEAPSYIPTEHANPFDQKIDSDAPKGEAPPDLPV